MQLSQAALRASAKRTPKRYETCSLMTLCVILLSSKTRDAFSGSHYACTCSFADFSFVRRQFARRGLNIVLISRSLFKLQETAKYIGELSFYFLIFFFIVVCLFLSLSPKPNLQAKEGETKSFFSKWNRGLEIEATTSPAVCYFSRGGKFFFFFFVILVFYLKVKWSSLF